MVSKIISDAEKLRAEAPGRIAKAKARIEAILAQDEADAVQPPSMHEEDDLQH